MAAFMSVLHMYESFGWWRRADYIKVHFAESWNEMHHLLIMEVIFFLQKSFLIVIIDIAPYLFFSKKSRCKKVPALFRFCLVFPENTISCPHL